MSSPAVVQVERLVNEGVEREARRVVLGDSAAEMGRDQLSSS
jgi:hypothetical protein